MTNGRPVALLAALLACLAGCSAGAASPAGPARTQAVAPSCNPPSPVTVSPSGFPEVQGSGRGVSLWGLLMFARHGAARVGDQEKIVLRMTGTGPLKLAATGPGGQHARLLFGPVEHGSSTFNKPGDEWGVGYVFTAPGCWDLSAVRGSLRADVQLTVVS